MAKAEAGELKHIDGLFRCLAQAAGVMAAIRNNFDNSAAFQLTDGPMANALWAVGDLIDEAEIAAQALFYNDPPARKRPPSQP
jgi:hypothetical protein